MAKGLKVDYKRINQQDAENFWNRLNKNNISEAELEDISEEIVNSEGINDYSDAVHETVGTMFVGDKQITDDFHSAKDKDIFKLSAQAVQRLVDTVDVYKEGTVSSYGKSYKLPKVTEKNKDAILMHFVSNIVAGEAAKGYLDNTVSLKRFATETTRDSEFIIPNVPEVEAAKEKIEKAKTAVKPTIGLGTRFLGYFQKKFGMDRPARRAYEEYHNKLNEYNSLKDVKKEEALISKFDSVNRKNESAITEGYAKVKAEREREAQSTLEAKKQIEMYEKNAENWDNWSIEVERSISSLKSAAMKDDFPDYARGILKDMKNTIKDMKNKDEAQKQYDALEEKFKDALKKQEQIKGKVSKIDDHKLSQKLGMNNKNVQVNKNHVQKAPVNELQKGHTY